MNEICSHAMLGFVTQICLVCKMYGFMKWKLSIVSHVLQLSLIVNQQSIDSAIKHFQLNGLETWKMIFPLLITIWAESHHNMVNINKNKDKIKNDTQLLNEDN